MNDIDRDRFQYWLIDMDDALERFKASLPPAVAGNADQTITSLRVLEEHYLSEFGSVQQAVLPVSAERIDGYARYLGETLRAAAGGQWALDLSDPRNAFHGLPQVKGAFGSLCPLTLVTAAADRRTADYWTTVVRNAVGRANAG